MTWTELKTQYQALDGHELFPCNDGEPDIIFFTDEADCETVQLSLHCITRVKKDEDEDIILIGYQPEGEKEILIGVMGSIYPVNLNL